jgi:hypothetical protein
VVVAVVDGVDVAKPTVPARSFAVAYPAFGKGRHPNTIGIQTVAEVEVLFLYPMLTRCYAISDIPMFADGGEGFDDAGRACQKA